MRCGARVLATWCVVQAHAIARTQARTRHSHPHATPLHAAATCVPPAQAPGPHMRIYCMRPLCPSTRRKILRRDGRKAPSERRRLIRAVRRRRFEQSRRSVVRPSVSRRLLRLQARLAADAAAIRAAAACATHMPTACVRTGTKQGSNSRNERP